MSFDRCIPIHSPRHRHHHQLPPQTTACHHHHSAITTVVHVPRKLPQSQPPPPTHRAPPASSPLATLATHSPPSPQLHALHTHTHTHTHTARSARAELWRAQDCAAGKSIWPHWSSVIRQLCRPASQGTRRNNKGRPPETSPSKTSGKHGAATQACSRVLHSAREQSIAE
jgi:hypothetical protein